MALYSIGRVKELPEKAALELTGNDILIIEDENNTCQIKLSELSTYIRNGLIDKDSFNKLMTDALSDIMSRLEKAESVYSFKINNVIKTLPVNLPGKDQETSDKYIQNQNNIELSFNKKSINEYELIVTEKAELNFYYSGGSITDEHQWYGIIIEFDTNNGQISYNETQSSGNWAESYIIDDSERYDIPIFNGVDLNTASEEDVDRTLNSLIVWLRADDDKQTFCFTNDENVIVKLDISVNKYVPEIIEEPEEEKQTYAVYQWDKVLGSKPEIIIEDKMLRINFNDNIPYISQEINGIFTSGHWIGIDIIPPIGFDTSNTQYPKIYYNGELKLEGWNNLFKQDEEGNVLTEDISKANMPIMFTELNRNILCTIDWGIGYIDIIDISTENGTLLYPSINA